MPRLSKSTPKSGLFTSKSRLQKSTKSALPEGVGLSSGSLLVIGCLMQAFLLKLDRSSAESLKACKAKTLKPKHVKAALFRVMHPHDAEQAGAEAQETTERWNALSKRERNHTRSPK